MKKWFTSSVILIFSFFSVLPVCAQKDQSYLKQFTPGDNSIPKNFSPPSKYGPCVSMANLKEALKNPLIYVGANFYNSGLSAVPPEIFLFPNLMEIDLSHNSITSLPNQFKDFKNLIELHLANNFLTDLGIEITSCKKLEVLYIQNNSLKNISNDLGKLTSLKKLWIESIDRKCIIPEEIWNLTNLVELRLIDVNLFSISNKISNFQWLNDFCVAHNHITSIPLEIFKLKKITYLNFGYNKIYAISPNINNLENLDYFGIYGNPVEKLPAEIGNLKKLSFLSCWNTNMTLGEIEKAQKLLPHTKVHFTDEDIH